MEGEDPLLHFSTWLEAAVAAGVAEPNSLVLASIGAATGSYDPRTGAATDSCPDHVEFWQGSGDRLLAGLNTVAPALRGRNISFSLNRKPATASMSSTANETDFAGPRAGSPSRRRHKESQRQVYVTPSCDYSPRRTAKRPRTCSGNQRGSRCAVSAANQH